QAEDGIRDFHVTGVQTCALPIWTRGEPRTEHEKVLAGPDNGGRVRGGTVSGRKSAMSLTASVKDELARLQVDRVSVRKAEVAATLRFAGGLHIISGRIVIEAELDLGVSARRLRQAMAELYGHTSDVVVVSGGGLKRGNRYVVRVVKDGESLARQTGLLDSRGR